ncbi:protein of unknown function (plasmid) [Rhodovastum atsumiense]|nr:protein of unknown function [Rhodovastum atsumiense]
MIVVVRVRKTGPSAGNSLARTLDELAERYETSECTLLESEERFRATFEQGMAHVGLDSS